MYRTVIYKLCSIEPRCTASFARPDWQSIRCCSMVCGDCLGVPQPRPFGRNQRTREFRKKSPKIISCDFLEPKCWRFRILRHAFGILDTLHHTWILFEDPLSSQEQQYLSSHELLFANKRKSQAFERQIIWGWVVGCRLFFSPTLLAVIPKHG